jgi:hypothetical protein
MPGLLERLLLQYKHTPDAEVLVIAVRQPSGAIETITNTVLLGEKMKYLAGAYDKDFVLKSNPEIRVVGFLLV